MANIVVFAGGRVGLDALRCLRGERVLRAYVSGEEYAREAGRAGGLEPGQVWCGGVSAEDLRGMDIDWMITAYWPRLLKPEIFGLAKNGCVNFHPALLPVNRGWYPHVHSIMDGTPTGVTLHLIDEGADTGPVLAQKKVELLPTDTAGDIYGRLQDEMVRLFEQKWPGIRDGQIRAAPQDEARAVYHKKSEIDGLDRIDPDKMYRARDLINLLRARSFGARGFAWYEDGGKVYVRVELNRTGVFE